ncbi:serine hydrolase domain-containing protein [Pseudokordiimonas caeni]|uniref:serine hydrolase domain-containing protein n=1 Tax=Pseudokordiimonas caeni TaxID=2997908 RepID=UPI0028127487|nr:serine hydrolase domain-containing protein [Pseudokordiimonas caeni]
MRKWLSLALMWALGTAPTLAQDAETETTAAPVAAVEAAPTPGTHPLTADDVNTWLDGFMPYALETGDIAGAVVVVVKDGEILTKRGFGLSDVDAGTPVDPDETLFRPGSVSKLFTWTALMQQVEAGKVSLDADINTYLDFEIPPAYGKPITVRDLLTHTTGFEETVKYLITDNPASAFPLGEILKKWTPSRIFAPGEIVAYSNYGAAIAGYIVERVSGEPFEDYVEKHIYAPLGMTHSSFRQPLPEGHPGVMSKGYRVASGEPQAFEIISLAPAGSMSATSTDMAKFMIAHLADGGVLLSPETAALMHATAFTPVPGLPGMALGFYHSDAGGETIIGHGGDTVFFHSDLTLFTDRNVGVFISVNSGGKNGASRTVRNSLRTGFLERYFSGPLQPSEASVDEATAKEHAALMAGAYYSSRRPETSWVSLFNILGQGHITVNADATITTDFFRDEAGVPKEWREIEPFVWQEVGGTSRLAAAVKDGKVERLSSSDLPPVLSFEPVPTSLSLEWGQPVLGGGLTILVLTAFSWPIAALIRRRYGYKLPIKDKALAAHRLTRVFAFVALGVIAGWFQVVSLTDSSLSALDGRLDTPMRLLQLVTLVALAGVPVSAWNAWLVWNDDRSRLVKLWSALIVVGMLAVAWIILRFRFLTLDLNF